MLIPPLHQIISSLPVRGVEQVSRRYMEMSIAKRDWARAWVALGMALDSGSVSVEDGGRIAELLIGRPCDVAEIRSRYRREWWQIWQPTNYRAAFKRYAQLQGIPGPAAPADVSPDILVR